MSKDVKGYNTEEHNTDILYRYTSKDIHLANKGYPDLLISSQRSRISRVGDILLISLELRKLITIRE